MAITETNTLNLQIAIGLMRQTWHVIPTKVKEWVVKVEHTISTNVSSNPQLANLQKARIETGLKFVEVMKQVTEDNAWKTVGYLDQFLQGEVREVEDFNTQYDLLLTVENTEKLLKDLRFELAPYFLNPIALNAAIDRKIEILKTKANV